MLFSPLVTTDDKRLNLDVILHAEFIYGLSDSAQYLANELLSLCLEFTLYKKVERDY